MGVVYLCKNITVGKLWAIKEIVQDVKNIDLLSEAKILKDLNHLGIRRIVDVFYENNNVYMVQDYVEGQTLKEYVRVNGRLQIEKICHITLELCDIIGYLHNLEPAIIYRDVKPSNIMISPSGKVVLIDFGISKVYKSDAENDTVCAVSNGYAAPEQYGLGKCCTRTDIYGIGMLIYFMLKGENPSTGIEPLLDEKYHAGIDDNLKRIIQSCVRIEMSDRYSSVGVLKKEVLGLLRKQEYEKKQNYGLHKFNINMIGKKLKTRVSNDDKLKRNVRKVLYFAVIILLNLM